MAFQFCELRNFMSNQPSVLVTPALGLIQQFALELAFVEPGKDTGLLPLNNFLLQIEELLPKESVPSEISAAVRLARVCIDRIFETTATFDARSVAWLAEWHGWIGTALDRLNNQLPIPAIPGGWNPSGGAEK